MTLIKIAAVETLGVQRMRNQQAAVARRISDPDFAGTLVNRVLTALMISMGLNIAFAIHDAWIWTHPVQPKYFSVDELNNPIPIQPLDSPVMGDTDLLNWSVQAILAPYNIDYFNYPVELNGASKQFTLRGWNTYAASFINSGNFNELKAARLLCHAQTQRAALIIQTNYVGGALAYHIEVPVSQTCENVNQTSTNNYMISAVVIRTNDPGYPKGLAIDQLVALQR
jgi:intracellular multiplication protein IcmL